MNTGVKDLIGFIKSVPKPRKVIIEEGSLANWQLETCTGYGEKLIITDPKKNRWIGRAGTKNDAVDAEKLAQLARGGYAKDNQVRYAKIANRTREIRPARMKRWLAET